MVDKEKLELPGDFVPGAANNGGDVENTDKSPWVSKTLWFNILAVLVLVAGSFGFTGELTPDWAAKIKPIVDFATDPRFVAVGTAVVNFVLRWVTTKPLAVKNEKLKLMLRG